MPRIDIRGKAGGGGTEQGGSRDASSIAGIDTSGINLNRIGMSDQDRSKTEYRLRSMVRNYDQYLVQEANKAEASMLATAERGAVAKTAIDKRQAQQERQRKQVADREYLANFKKLLADEDREKKKAAQVQEKDRRDQARTVEKEAREQARAQQRVERQQQQESRSETHRRAHMRRENVKAFGFGAVAGGVIGGAAAGDLGGVLGAVGGGLGGGIGSIVGSAFGPMGAMVGKAIGSAIGSLAGVAVNPYHAAYGASKPYLDFTESTAALGRRRGEFGDGIDHALFNRTTMPPQWMQDIGMGPQSAAKALSGLGYTPQGNIQQTLTTIGNLTNKSAAFAGLGQDAVTGLLGRAGAYGINSTTETGTGKTQSTVDLLTQAVARGLDSSRILESVDGSLDSMVSQSGRADLEGITKLTQQMMMTGTPGGMTGATAKNIISAAQAQGENVLGNTSLSAGLTMLATKEYGGLKTAQQVARWAGVKSSDELDPKMLEEVLSNANSGSLNAAIELSSTKAIQGAHLQSLAADAFKYMGLPENKKSLWLRGALGSSLSDAQGFTSGLQFPSGMNGLDQGIMAYNGSGPKAVAYAGAVENRYSKMFGGSASAAFDKKIGKAGYLKKLLASGIDPEVAKDIVNSAEKRSLNPLLLASVGMQESNLNKKQGRSAQNPNGTYDSGIMQVNNDKDNLAKYPNAFKSLSGNIDAGAGILAAKLKSHGGFGDQGSASVATSALRGKAIAEQGDLHEAFLSFKTLEPAARQFASAVAAFENAVKEFVNGKGPYDSTKLWTDHKQVIHNGHPAPFTGMLNKHVPLKHSP